MVELNKENTNVEEVSIILTMISYFDGKRIQNAIMPSSVVNISFAGA